MTRRSRAISVRTIHLRSRSERGHTWTVGAHLIAAVVLILVVFGTIGAYSAAGTLRQARHAAIRDATSQAGTAAKAVTATAALAQTEVAALAANPGIVAVFASPSGCRLTFALDLIPDGHLDLVTPDGRVVCSSRPAKTGQAPLNHAGATWLATLSSAKGVFLSAPFDDPVTHQNTVVIGVPVAGADGRRVGGVVLVAPTGAMADRLAQSYGGPQHYLFSVTDGAHGTLLAAPTALGPPNPISTRSFLYGSAPVAGLGWQVFAGVRPATALGPTRSLLAREGLLGVLAIVLFLGLLAVIRRRIAAPLKALTQVIGDTGPHVDRVLAGVGGTTEVARLAVAFQDMVEGRDAYEAQLSHQALHDPLTGLPNRALLADRLGQALRQSGRSPGTVSVLFVDIDRFKLVNDSLGHSTGDQVLILLGARLANFVRSGDTLARFGGDEFVIVCQDVENAQQAMELARRVGEVVAEPLDVSDRIIRVTASIGVALAGDSDRAEDLIRDADTAMYAAKERGGAIHELFDLKLHCQATVRLTLETELRVALERSELRVVYQPKVNLATEAIVGMEALLRWDHPSLGSVSPAVFIPVAEETGLIVPIGRFVLEQACQQAAWWQQQGHDISVAVNISGRQLADPELAHQLAAILVRTELSADRVTLELTESVLMADETRTATTLDTLKDLGVELSIDDFGTGYSSLSYLQRFPVDELKIDRVFINEVTEHTDNHKLVVAMIAMGTALGLRIVAEGVETTAQATELRHLGCHQAQGYLYATPGSPAAVTALIYSRHPVGSTR